MNLYVRDTDTWYKNTQNIGNERIRIVKILAQHNILYPLLSKHFRQNHLPVPIINELL